MTAGATQAPVGTERGAAVEVVDLVKEFGSVQAVDNVSLAVEPGEFLALLGPSGSGKTTILNTIAGFEQPTSGLVRIDGRDVTRVPPYRRQIGLVFQHYALFPHRTVAENVSFPLRMRRVLRRERMARVEDALDLVRLSGLGERMPGQLSGGQQQRVALARAIVYRPPVLLMDEPLGALDKKLREHMQLELRALQRQLGTTVIYVTHDQEEALTMADRIAVLHEGRLQQLGTPEELYERPTNAFVADFVGETNFLVGTLASRNGRVGLVEIARGLTVRALLSNEAQATLQEGSDVRVAMRPDRVALHRPGAGDRESHPGSIETVVYAGSTLACVVRLTSGAKVTARVATSQDGERWKTGDAVEVSWRPEDASVYSEDFR